MKKGFIISIIVSVLILLAVGIGVIYTQSKSDLNLAKEEAIQKAKTVGITKVQQVDWFHYLEQYMVVEGLDNEDQSLIVWIPNNEEKEIVVEAANDGLTRDEAAEYLKNKLSSLSNDKRPKKIMKIKLGMVDDLPVYEITYKDQMDRYSIMYLDFYRGQWFRVYNL